MMPRLSVGRQTQKARDALPADRQVAGRQEAAHIPEKWDLMSIRRKGEGHGKTNRQKIRVCSDLDNLRREGSKNGHHAFRKSQFFKRQLNIK